ncbi:transcriptional regulator [Streptomyces sp. WAC05292]|uniref:DUF5324 family protein n=1 Tax=Streptomyces sp. WAC05292 TaxID=2487418 RepID=UPI000F73F351|nr:DUF5324 family protein [Streptomyces sp. WAC05292]RSS96791.1 transcriptional regulator [Streptomyces sp. WAC05292]
MTRKDSVRLCADSARDTMKHAAEVVAPYAETAKEAAVHYAHEANDRLAPLVAQTAHQASRQARTAYECHLHPRLKAARTHVPPHVDRAAVQAVHETRRVARQAADYAGPRLEHAIAAGRPVAEEAASRSVAAIAALRGQVSAQEVQRLIRRHERRARTGRVLKGLAVAAAVAGAAYAAWRWWDSQSSPDWLVEPPAATELSSRQDTPANFDDELAEKEREATEEE